ncbi:hypothetical protein ACM6Q7_27760 [Peribacillus butanolivorans]|uniref:hypothetical protein n=1 Tax=Peribacillus butanolivorans TaxID=421767 RepID=UPI0039FC7262
MDLADQPEKLLEDYYKIYPSDLINFPEELKTILFECNVSKRGRSFLEIALRESYIKEENVDAINELTILVWQGMFTNILNNRKSYDFQTAAKTMNYITEIVHNANLFHFKK